LFQPEQFPKFDLTISEINWKEKPASATKDPLGFAGICGMDSLKEELSDQMESILDSEAAGFYDLNPPSGLLLYGPPGNGKSWIAQKFAEELSIRFKKPVYVEKIAASSIGSKWLHETSANIKNVFEKVEQEAKKNRSYGVIIIDEIDTFIPKSSSLTGSTGPEAARNEERGAFLTSLEKAHQMGIYVIATTNFPERLDDALIRPGRFDTKVEVKHPDQPMIEQLMRSMLYLALHADDINFRGYSMTLARARGGTSVAEVKHIMECAKRLALRASRNSPELVPVNNAMVRQAVQEHYKMKFSQV
jgi:transitional endoplasmic reticulum ATPase